MSRKDLRNGKESARWRPGKWEPARAVRVRNHVLDHAYHVLCCDVGDYCAGLALVETRAMIGAAVSRDAVHAAGMKTLGE